MTIFANSENRLRLNKAQKNFGIIFGLHYLCRLDQRLTER